MSKCTHAQVSIVIPTLNEETAIRQVLQGIPYSELGQVEVLVVDGGSNDGTLEVAKALGVTVIRQSQKGYGQAILEGLKHAQGEFIVLIDGDGVYDPREIPKMLIMMQSQRADMVIGSRYLGVIEPGAMPSVRSLGNRLFSLMVNLLFNTRITDFNSGFRILRKSLMLRIENKITEPVQYSMILSAHTSDSKVVEAPITFYPRIGKAKISLLSERVRLLMSVLMKGLVGTK